MNPTPNVTRCVIQDGADPTVMVAATLTLTALTPHTAEALVTGPVTRRIPLASTVVMDWHTRGWGSDPDAELHQPVLLLADHAGQPQIVHIRFAEGRHEPFVVRTTRAAVARLLDDLAAAADTGPGLDELLAGGAA